MKRFGGGIFVSNTVQRGKGKAADTGIISFESSTRSSELWMLKSQPGRKRFILMARGSELTQTAGSKIAYDPTALA